MTIQMLCGMSHRATDQQNRESEAYGMQPDTPVTSDRPDPMASHANSLDNPGIRIPPPVIYIVVFLGSLWLQSRFPLPFLAPPVALGVGAALSATGTLFVATAIPTMLRGHGTLSTAGTSAALVAQGPYRYSRNPMYLGLLLLYSGFACVFAVVWALPLLIPLIVYTRVGVIAPEEHYLARAFGDAYRAYQARVRRWL